MNVIKIGHYFLAFNPYNVDGIRSYTLCKRGSSRMVALKDALVYRSTRDLGRGSRRYSVIQKGIRLS